MKKIVLSLVVVVGLLLSAGVGYAAGQWLNFTGDNAVEESKSDIDEIISILEEVHAGKVSAEEALAELEALNPPGLAKQNKELREKNDKLVKDNTNLAMRNTDLVKERKELQTSNENLVNTINKLENDITTLNGTNKELLNTIDGLKKQIAQLEEDLANAPEDQTEYVAHLEAELQRANEAVEKLSGKTKSAVEKAKSYK